MINATVIICTHNPDKVKIKKVLKCINESETSYEFEKLIIDNASSNQNFIKNLAEENNFEYVREQKIGLSHARLLAMKKCSDKLIIFIDDDNYISRDFIHESILFSLENPDVVAFGGRVLPFNSPRRKWKRSSMPFLGIRDLGDSVLKANVSSSWQVEEPIGAGLCLSTSLVHEFLHLPREKLEIFLKLGRKGRRLLSGEDGFICRFLSPHGYVAYVPSMVMHHDIDLNRLNLKYLIKLMFNYGRSDFYLEKMVSSTEIKSQFWETNFKNFLFYIRQFNLAGVLNYTRSLGYIWESKFYDRR